MVAWDGRGGGDIIVRMSHAVEFRADVDRGSVQTVIEFIWIEFTSSQCMKRCQECQGSRASGNVVAVDIERKPGEG